MNTPRQEMVQTLEERAEGETARRGNEPEVAWKGFPGKHSSAGPIGIVGLDQTEEEEGEMAISAGTPEQAKWRYGRIPEATEGQEPSSVATRGRA